MCLEVMRRTMIRLGLGRDLDPGPPEYEAGALLYCDLPPEIS
jgi:hypothetical protein